MVEPEVLMFDELSLNLSRTLMLTIFDALRRLKVSGSL